MFTDSSFAEPYKSWAQLASNLGSLAAVVAAAIWFFTTSKFRRRVQFDLDCKIYEVADVPKVKITEIQLCFENKGLVDHRIRELTVSIHALLPERPLETKAETGELQFPRVLLDETNIVPLDYGYYFIRPGVRQVITHITPIDAGVSLIRITAGFKYGRIFSYPHTVRRVFSTRVSLGG